MKMAIDNKTTFSKKKKKEAIAKPEGKKDNRSQPHIRVPTFPLSTLR